MVLKRAPQRNQIQEIDFYHQEKIWHNLQVLHVCQDLTKNPNQHCPQNLPLLAKSEKKNSKIRNSSSFNFIIASRLWRRVAAAWSCQSPGMPNKQTNRFIAMFWRKIWKHLIGYTSWMFQVSTIAWLHFKCQNLGLAVHQHKTIFIWCKPKRKF